MVRYGRKFIQLPLRWPMVKWSTWSNFSEGKWKVHAHWTFCGPYWCCCTLSQAFFCACNTNWLISQCPIQLLLNFIISPDMYKISNLLIRPNCSTICYIFNCTEATQLPLSVYLAAHLCNCLLTYQIIYNYVLRQLELGCRPASIPSVLLESYNASELQSDGDGGILRFQFFVTCWLYHSLRSRSTIQGLHVRVSFIYGKSDKPRLICCAEKSFHYPGIERGSRCHICGKDDKILFQVMLYKDSVCVNLAFLVSILRCMDGTFHSCLWGAYDPHP